MSLNWIWKEEVGTLEYRDFKGKPVTLHLWQGNALLIAQYNIPDTTQYQLMFFFANKEHMENCFGEGAKRGYREDNMFSEEPWEKLTFNEKMNLKDLITIVKIVRRHFPKCEIIIKENEENEDITNQK